MFVPIYDSNKLKDIPFQFVTLLLIALNVAVYAVQVSGMDIGAVISFALIPSELLQVGYFGGPAASNTQTVLVPEGYTLISYMFFHGSLLHLASNMMFLWVFGDNVEDALGHFKFLIFYLLCGICGGLFHTTMMPDSPSPMIGASGAVSGVIAAYLLLHPRVQLWVLVMRFIPIRISAAWALGAWILLQFVMIFADRFGLYNGPIAWWAHAGGLIAGALLVIILRRPGVALFDQDIKSA